jgi:hypothetical protein
LTNLSLKDGFKVERVNHLFKHILFVDLLQSLADDDRLGLLILGDGIYILNLDERLHLLIDQLLEIILEFVTSEMSQNGFPVWSFLELAQVWFHVTLEYAECR